MIQYIIFIGGLILGALFTHIFFRIRAAGTLRIIESTEPEEQPYLFVELNRSVHEVSKCKQVTFNISLK